MFPRGAADGNNMNCFLRDQSISKLFYSTKRKTCNGNGNSNGGRWSTFVGTCNSTLLPFDVIDFALLTRDSDSDLLAGV